jgi:hypothetical protein
MPKSREQEVLDGMPFDIRTTPELRKQFKMCDTNVRRILKRLVAKGYVAKEVISVPGRKYNKQTVGWRKLDIRKKHFTGCMLGGLAKADTTPGQHRMDVAEVRKYMKSHKGASVFDVALECHMTDQQAARLMKEG